MFEFKSGICQCPNAEFLLKSKNYCNYLTLTLTTDLKPTVPTGRKPFSLTESPIWMFYFKYCNFTPYISILWSTPHSWLQPCLLLGFTSGAGPGLSAAQSKILHTWPCEPRKPCSTASESHPMARCTYPFKAFLSLGASWLLQSRKMYELNMFCGLFRLT